MPRKHSHFFPNLMSTIEKQTKDHKNWPQPYQDFFGYWAKYFPFLKTRTWPWPPHFQEMGGRTIHMHLPQISSCVSCHDLILTKLTQFFPFLTPCLCSLPRKPFPHPLTTSLLSWRLRYLFYSFSGRRKDGIFIIWCLYFRWHWFKYFCLYIAIKPLLTMRVFTENIY